MLFGGKIIVFLLVSDKTKKSKKSTITFREIRGYNEWLDSLDYEDFEAVQSMTAEDLAQREVVGTFIV